MMKPPDARIILVDDSKIAHIMVPRAIEKLGANLVASARTADEASKIIDDILR